MKIGIFPNDRPECPAQMTARGIQRDQYAREVQAFIRARGHEVVQEEEEADVWISLGGDGTMLGAVRHANGVPVLGINLGNVGFLTDVGKADGFTALTALLDGRYTVQNRIMLEAAKGSIAVNELVAKCNRLTRYEVRIDGEPLFNLRADGIIIATPTGSTAYNRSAGGPILLPQSASFAITPICAVDAAAPSWVVPATGKISLIAQRDVSVELDGALITSLPAETALTVRRAVQSARFIVTDKNGGTSC
ncbi:MAG: NAD(+)/NADH kinase [Defluviitaleaceae bacterium]|nr:NAD(+)/NADH kinase [Defluviitaleaceae bacterium]